MDVLKGIPKSYIARAADQLRADNRRLRNSLTAAEVVAQCPKAIEHLWRLELCLPRQSLIQEVPQLAKEGASLLRARNSHLRWRTDSEILRAFGARYVQALMADSSAAADDPLSGPPATAQASETRSTSRPKSAAGPKKNTRTPRRSTTPRKVNMSQVHRAAAPAAGLPSSVAAAPETKLRSRGSNPEGGLSRSDKRSVPRSAMVGGVGKGSSDSERGIGGRDADPLGRPASSRRCRADSRPSSGRPGASGTCSTRSGRDEARQTAAAPSASSMYAASSSHTRNAPTQSVGPPQIRRACSNSWAPPAPIVLPPSSNASERSDYEGRGHSGPPQIAQARSVVVQLGWNSEAPANAPPPPSPPRAESPDLPDLLSTCDLGAYLTDASMQQSWLKRRLAPADDGPESDPSYRKRSPRAAAPSASSSGPRRRSPAAAQTANGVALPSLSATLPVDVLRIEAIVAEASADFDGANQACGVSDASHPAPGNGEPLLQRLKPGDRLVRRLHGRDGVVVSNNPFFRLMHIDCDGGVLEATYAELHQLAAVEANQPTAGSLQGGLSVEASAGSPAPDADASKLFDRPSFRGTSCTIDAMAEILAAEAKSRETVRRLSGGQDQLSRTMPLPVGPAGRSHGGKDVRQGALGARNAPTSTVAKGPAARSSMRHPGANSSAAAARAKCRGMSSSQAQQEHSRSGSGPAGPLRARKSQASIV